MPLLLDLWTSDQVVVQALMRTFFEIELFELSAKDVHEHVTEGDEMVKTFLLERLDKAFAEKILLGERMAVLCGLIFRFFIAARNGFEYFPSLSCISLALRGVALRETFKLSKLLKWRFN